MRSSVPCSSWIDSFSLLDIQVVSLKRDYYVSLACQVDFAQNNPSRNTHRCWLSGGLRNHTLPPAPVFDVQFISRVLLLTNLLVPLATSAGQNQARSRMVGKSEVMV